MITEGMLAVFFMGCLHFSAEYDHKFYFVSRERTKPAETTEGYMQLRCGRNTAGDTIIAIFDGMNISGLLKPDTPADVKAIQQRLKYISHLWVEESEAAEEAEDTMEQMTMEGKDE